MGQLDRTALLSPQMTQSLGLDHAAWLHALHIAHPYHLMPYELAEVQESSLAMEEAISEGDPSAAQVSPWGLPF